MSINVFADLIPEADAAAAAGESLKTWQRRRHARTGPAYIQRGRSVLYRPDAIREWLLSLEVKPRKARAA